MHSKVTRKTLPKGKSQRINKALEFLRKHPIMSARKTAQIYNCDPSSISKHLAGKTKSQTSWAKARQLLSPVKEEVLTKWALQYYAWGLPLQIRHLQQLAIKILTQKDPTTKVAIGKHWYSYFLARNPTLKLKLSSPITAVV
jgi:hypothetical protein